MGATAAWQKRGVGWWWIRRTFVSSRARAEDWDIDASVRARHVGGALMRQERGSKRTFRRFRGAHEKKKAKQVSDGFAHDRGGWATRGTIGPPYASALEGWVAGTTTSRCTTSPSRARWSSRKDTACSECGASSTGAKKTRDSLGGAERGGVVAVAGSESAATARGSARSPVASRGVSLAGGSEEAAAPAIARVFSLRAFASSLQTEVSKVSTTCERRRGAFSGAFRVLFPLCFASRRSLPKRARSHHLPTQNRHA